MAEGLKITVDTSFAQETLKALSRVPKEIRKGVSVALREESKQVARDARAILRDQSRKPVSRTGETARLTRHKRGRGGLVYLVETKASPSKGPVGLWLEYGTEQGGRRVTQRSRSFERDRRGFAFLQVRRRSTRIGGFGRTPAYPYITAALERRQDTTQRVLGDAIAEAIEAAAESIGG